MSIVLNMILNLMKKLTVHLSNDVPRLVKQYCDCPSREQKK